jgi:hypothetical protein
MTSRFSLHALPHQAGTTKPVSIPLARFLSDELGGFSGETTACERKFSRLTVCGATDTFLIREQNCSKFPYPFGISSLSNPYEVPTSGTIPYAVGQASIVRIPVPGTNGLAIELRPRGYVPPSGSTSTLFFQDPLASVICV